jgi:hypothetical protein
MRSNVWLIGLVAKHTQIKALPVQPRFSVVYGSM